MAATISLGDLVSVDHTRLGVDLASDEAAIRLLSGLLAATVHVTEGHAAACVARERTDPTGLPTAGTAVAIPHADPGTVLRPAVAIAVPSEPVPFRQLGDPDVIVDAGVVFLLALTGADEQLAALRQVAALVQDADGLRAIVEAGDAAEIVALVRANQTEVET